MKNVPNIISTKDLSYIEDILNWNFILIKKINNYLCDIQDKDVYKILDKAYTSLNKTYADILGYLE